MPVEKLKAFLEDRNVPYETVAHPQTFTAQRTAESVHVRGKEMAKVVIVTVDGTMAMVVLPADSHVDLKKVKQATGARAVGLAKEDEFQARFPGCDVGAMPPFGNLYDMMVFEDRELAEDETIAFNAGTHTEVIKLAYQDYKDLVEPVIGDFAKRTA